MVHDKLILDAVVMARETHKNAKRKFSGKPYLLHPLRVMGRVAAHQGASSFEVAAAVLHDTVEDMPDVVSLERIERQIHPKCAIYVSNLTSPSKKLMLPDGRYPKEWSRKKRVQLNCDHVHLCDYWTQTMKGYDRGDNLEELTTDLFNWGLRPDTGFVEMYCDESVLLVSALDKIEKWQRDELERTVSLLRSIIATPR